MFIKLGTSYDGATVTLTDHRSLLEYWKGHGATCVDLAEIGHRRTPRSVPVCRFHVERPLTASQYRRLPVKLRALVQAPDDSAAWLARLWALQDPRG